MKWGLRCSDLCKTSCHDRRRSSRVASFVFNASANALDAGDGTLGLLTWMLMSEATDLRRSPRQVQLGMRAAARRRGLSA